MRVSLRAALRCTMARSAAGSPFNARRARDSASGGAALDSGASSPRDDGTIQSSSHSPAPGRATDASVQHASHSALMKRSSTAALTRGHGGGSRFGCVIAGRECHAGGRGERDS